MRIVSRIVSTALLVAAFAGLTAAPGHAASFKVIYDFCGKASCTDGDRPQGDVFIDASGNLFGTTAAGGAANAGTFYELVRDASTGKWKHTTLYDFCAKADCADGGIPTGKLIADTKGNFYGVTYAHGANGGSGAAYRLSPTAHGKWKSKTLYSFCTIGNCLDGFGVSGGLTYRGAQSGLPYDGKSPLYGMTRFGGTAQEGIVYQLTRAKGGWTESIVHNFCTETETCDLDDGSGPAGAPVMDGAGNLFGATEGGGPNFGGTIFKLSPNGGSWNETILHSFCDQTSCEEGLQPTGIVMNAGADFFGSTQQSIGQENTDGVSFKLSADGDYSVSHKFCSESGCVDGRQPFSSVTIDGAGNVMGTTISGGGHNNDPNHNGGGVVYRVTTAGKFDVLHAFCAKANCADGAYPQTSAVAGADGHLYGTTSAGGKYGHGVVYELVP